MGSVLTDDKDVEGVFHNFYSNLFSEDHSIDCNVQSTFINCLRKSVISDDKEELNDLISLDEVKGALGGTAKNKAPGIDGIPYEFYSRFFNVIGGDLTEVYYGIFVNGSLSDSQRTAVISLLPKKGDLLEPKNWRPISLLNCDYKLLAKVLQRRLSKVMTYIVNDFQTCSIPGRSIHNNMYLLRDIIEYADINNSPVALLSLDQEKAFDKVHWGFLMRVLRKLDLGDNFI